MKHTIIIAAFALCSAAATAKTNVNKLETVVNPAASMHKPFFNHTRLEVTGSEITFSKLPLQATAMYIVDDKGHVASSGTVSRKNNKVNIKQLQPGLYTIVLKHGSRVKLFGYHTDVVVKGAKATS